jgi:beta-lactamase superfamily II metal-dependent hydrolase
LIIRFSSIITFLFLIVGYPPAAHAGSELEIHFIDVGQGDCTLINLPDGDIVLVDAGSPAAGPKVVNYLKSIGVDHIDHLIFTHAHDDHIGGIFSLSSEFKTHNIYDNGFSNFFDSILYEDYVTLIRNDMLKYKILQAGESLPSGSVRIRILNPLLPPTGNLNEDSLVLKLSYGNINILLAGDMGHLGEKRLLQTKIDLNSQILKAGHHGDNNAGSVVFLHRVKPKIAIISVAAENKYAQPGEAALKRLQNSGAKIYRTDKNGTIIIITNGQTYSVKTEKTLDSANANKVSH